MVDPRRFRDLLLGREQEFRFRFQPRAGWPNREPDGYHVWDADVQLRQFHQHSSGNYNGLAAKLTQRFGTNLNTLLSYTYSKAIDTTSAIRGTVGSDFSPQDARCPNSCEKAPSDFNVPQRFVASIIGALPFGKG